MSISAAHSVLDGLATLLAPATGGLAAALAIILLTIAVRLLISPLGWLQARSARRGAALAPQLAELREKHSDDPVRLASETLALQRANGASPFAALLPALAQAPFFMLMFRLVQPGSGTATGVLAGSLFGVPLTAHLAAGWPVFAGLLLVAALVAWWSWRRMRATVPPLLGALPFLTVLMVAWLPLAGGLYLVTSAAWTALEQAVWRRSAPPANR